jgi:hypothetical protein
MLRAAEEAENKRLEASEKQINDEKNLRIEKSRAAMESAIRSIQIRYKLFALPAAILAPLFVALLMLVIRVTRERSAS